ncbi:hypothetical protein, partial [Paenibacillus sacheonensis]|uniref:hypothetical protein n=1 Tax=Paenibacillus sacheonensis TaxID=742054 RepID=UPI001BABFBD3
CVWANHHFLLLLNHLVTRTLSCCFNYKEKKEQAPQKWRAYSFFHFFSGLAAAAPFLLPTTFLQLSSNFPPTFLQLSPTSPQAFPQASP